MREFSITIISGVDGNETDGSLGSQAAQGLERNTAEFRARLLGCEERVRLNLSRAVHWGTCYAPVDSTVKMAYRFYVLISGRFGGLSVFTMMDARTKRIWGGLVSFANAGTVPNAAKELRRTVTDYVPWFLQADPFELLADMDEEQWLKAAAEYQPSAQALLRWLCSTPNSAERDSLRPQALSFLRKHAEHVGGAYLAEVDYVEEPKPDAEGKFDPEKLEQHEESMKYWTRTGKARDDSPLGIYTISKHYKDVADPICEFICYEYLKFRNGQYKKSVPIFACPQCAKFVMPKRIGTKKFCSDCSDKARAEQHRKKAAPGEGKDYQYLYRLVGDLEHEPPNVIKMRLQNAKIRKRIGEISNRQRTSAKCKKLLGRLKQWRAIRVRGGFRGFTQNQ